MRKALALLSLTLTATTASAGDGWEFLSSSGYGAFLGYGAYRSFHSGKEEGTRYLDSWLSSTLLCEGLKRATRVPRPHTGEHDSFPSGHATAAFAIATFEAEMHPKEAMWWYAGAALIGQSRVELGRHRERDVVAGALLGYFVSKAELRSKGFLIQPTAKGGILLGLHLRY